MTDQQRNASKEMRLNFLACCYKVFVDIKKKKKEESFEDSNV